MDIALDGARPEAPPPDDTDVPHTPARLLDRACRIAAGLPSRRPGERITDTELETAARQCDLDVSELRAHAGENGWLA